MSKKEKELSKADIQPETQDVDGVEQQVASISPELQGIISTLKEKGRAVLTADTPEELFAEYSSLKEKANGLKLFTGPLSRSLYGHYAIVIFINRD